MRVDTRRKRRGTPSRSPERAPPWREPRRRRAAAPRSPRRRPVSYIADGETTSGYIYMCASHQRVATRAPYDLVESSVSNVREWVRRCLGLWTMESSPDSQRVQWEFETPAKGHMGPEPTEILGGKKRDSRRTRAIRGGRVRGGELGGGHRRLRRQVVFRF